MMSRIQKWGWENFSRKSHQLWTTPAYRHLSCSGGPFNRFPTPFWILGYYQKVLDSPPSDFYLHLLPDKLPHPSSLLSPFYRTDWILKSCTLQAQTLIIPPSSGLIFSDLTKLLRSCRLYSCDRTHGDKKRISWDKGEINRNQFSF